MNNRNPNKRKARRRLRAISTSEVDQDLAWLRDHRPRLAEVFAKILEASAAGESVELIPYDLETLQACIRVAANSLQTH